jgi:hypothetical protein
MTEDRLRAPWEEAKRKQAYQIQEERYAKGGGKQQINSGRLWFSKGDVKKFNFLTNNKITGEQSFTIRLTEWLQDVHNAHFHDLLPAWQPTIQNHHFFLCRLPDIEYFFEQYALVVDEVMELRSQLEEAYAPGEDDALTE